MKICKIAALLFITNAFLSNHSALAAPNLTVKKGTSLDLTSIYPSYSDQVLGTAYPSPVILKSNRFAEGAVYVGAYGGSDYFGFVGLKNGQIINSLPIEMARNLRNELGVLGVDGAGVSKDGLKGFAWNSTKACEVTLSGSELSCVEVSSLTGSVGTIITASFDSTANKTVVFSTTGINGSQPDLFEHSIESGNTAVLKATTDPHYDVSKKGYSNYSIGAIETTLIYPMQDGYYSLLPTSTEGIKKFSAYPSNDSMHDGHFYMRGNTLAITKSSKSKSFYSFLVSTGINKKLSKGAWKTSKVDKLYGLENAFSSQDEFLILINKNSGLKNQTYHYRIASGSDSTSKFCESKATSLSKASADEIFGIDSDNMLYQISKRQIITSPKTSTIEVLQLKRTKC